jgi:transposase-like protein
MAKRLGQNFGIRYSEAFKMAIVREVEEQDLPFEQVRRKYGIGGSWTVQKWVRQYGNGNRGKIIRVERPKDINELVRLRAELRRVKEALADAHIDLALERAFTQLACERAGVDVAEFKKKRLGGGAPSVRTAEAEAGARRHGRRGMPAAWDEPAELLRATSAPAEADCRC